MSERKFRRRIERHAAELVREIDLYFRGVTSWDEAGRGGDPDPDGRLRRLRANLTAPQPREGVNHA